MSSQNINCLPVGANPSPIEFRHFPTRQQTFVFRNWDIVPTDRLAAVLETTRNNVEALAEEMGLPVPAEVSDEWLKRGYNTILRANWHLLPYEQLLVLLGWSIDRLNFVLKEDDFMWVKLGCLKPRAEWLRHRPLTKEERQKTALVRDSLKRHFPDLDKQNSTRPFDFIRILKEPELISRQTWAEPKHGEISLDNGWVLCSLIKSEKVRKFIQRFVHDHKARWGIDLGSEENTVKQNQRGIYLKVVPDNSLQPESHVIDVNERQIVIQAVDEVGLLRGLQWMENAMIKRGGHYLRDGLIRRPTRFDLRLIYPFDAPYADPLMVSDKEICPDAMLERFSRSGVNGIWLQGILYTLCPWEIEPELSSGYERRLATLRRLTERAADHGIGVYLYLDEPRGMALDFFKRHPEYRSGVEEPGRALGTFCTSYPPVLQRLHDASAYVFRQVPELAGVFTITMSENPTHCYSLYCYPAKGQPGAPSLPACPLCSRRKPEEIIAEVSRTIAEGVHSVKPSAQVIAWTWAWDVPEFNVHLERLHPAVISLLPKNIKVMCTSEEALNTHIGGIAYSVYDYTISQIGPSERSRSVWNKAQEHGMKTIAKVQVNNSWECSAIPYLPVYENVGKHLDNLLSTPVTGLMLSWTLGGYPSPILDYAATYYWQDQSGANNAAKHLDEFIRGKFGSGVSKKLLDVLHDFSTAFSNFPFCMRTAYNGPHNFGPMNLLYESKTCYQSTMVGYPYDDLESWRGVYPLEVFESQFQKLSENWLVGLKKMADIKINLPPDKQAAFEDMENVSLASWIHFRSAYLQIRFVRLRNSLEDEKKLNFHKETIKQIIKILEEEIELARRMHDLVLRDSRIGFEPTQHYCYTPQLLREKVVNCEYLRTVFLKKAVS